MKHRFYTITMLILLSSLTLGCSDIENPLSIQHKYQPINKVYDSKALIGTGDFNPKYVPVLGR